MTLGGWGRRGILDNSKSPDTFALSLGSVGEILLPIMCLQRNRVRSPLCFFNTWWGGGLAYEYRACSIIRIYFRWIFSKPSIRLQVEWNWFNLEETKREDESDKSLETIWVHQLLSTFNRWGTVNSYEVNGRDCIIGQAFLPWMAGESPSVFKCHKNLAGEGVISQKRKNWNKKYIFTTFSE